LLVKTVLKTAQPNDLRRGRRAPIHTAIRVNKNNPGLIQNDLLPAIEFTAGTMASRVPGQFRAKGHPPGHASPVAVRRPQERAPVGQ